MANVYIIGQQVRLSCSFTTLADVAADPTTVVLTVRPPDGVNTTPTPIKDSTGNYHADVTLNQAGDWNYRWTGAGALIAAGENWLTVDPSKVV